MQWYILIDVEEIGPLSSGEFKTRAEQGRVGPTTKIRRTSDEDWFEAKRVKGLVFDILSGEHSELTDEPSDKSQESAAGGTNSSTGFLAKIPKAAWLGICLGIGFLVIASFLVRWYKTEVHNAEIERANAQVHKAIEAARKWIDENELDKAEQELGAALGNDLATNKSLIEPYVQEVEAARKRAAAEAIYESAVANVNDGNPEEAIRLLTRYLKSEAASRVEHANELLQQIRELCSPEAASELFLTFTDDEFEAFNQNRVIPLRLGTMDSHRDLMPIYATILGRGLPAEVTRRGEQETEREKLRLEAERIALEKQREEERQAKERMAQISQAIDRAVDRLTAEQILGGLFGQNANSISYLDGYYIEYLAGQSSLSLDERIARGFVIMQRIRQELTDKDVSRIRKLADIERDNTRGVLGVFGYFDNFLKLRLRREKAALGESLLKSRVNYEKRLNTEFTLAMAASIASVAAYVKQNRNEELVETREELAATIRKSLTTIARSDSAAIEVLIEIEKIERSDEELIASRQRVREMVKGGRERSE